MISLSRVGMVAAMMFITGCSVAPILREYPTLPQALDTTPSREGLSRVTFFNDSNALMFGPDGSGVMNIFVDGKGVGQLRIREYTTIELPHGEHLVELSHKDVFMFRSEHRLSFSGQQVFVKVNATVLSNEAEIVSKPTDLSSKFRAAPL